MRRARPPPRPHRRRTAVRGVRAPHEALEILETQHHPYLPVRDDSGLEPAFHDELEHLRNPQQQAPEREGHACSPDYVAALVVGRCVQPLQAQASGDQPMTRSAVGGRCAHMSESRVMRGWVWDLTWTAAKQCTSEGGGSIREVHWCCYSGDARPLPLRLPPGLSPIRLKRLSASLFDRTPWPLPGASDGDFGAFAVHHSNCTDLDIMFVCVKRPEIVRCVIL